MTNREWLESLSDEDFTTWLLQPDEWDWRNRVNYEPTPRLETLKYASTQATTYIKEWLEKEHTKSLI